MQLWSTELSRLSYPHHRWGRHTSEGWSAEIYDLLETDEDGAVERFQEAYEDLFNARRVNISRVDKKFAEKHAAIINSHFGSKGEKIKKLGRKGYAMADKKIYEAMAANYKGKTGLENMAGEQKLALFSPWMADFSVANGEQLELPGQYTGFSMPRPEQHAKVDYLS